MKIALMLVLVGLSFNLLAKFLTVPFYMAIPVDAHLPLPNNEWVKIPIADIGADLNPKTDKIFDTDKAYLRAYYFEDGSFEGRKKVLRELYEKNIIKPGDVILSSNYSWVNTTPYAHIQMGASHIGLVYQYADINNLEGEIRDIDSPLYEDGHLFKPERNVFSSKHFNDAPITHILRPTKMNERMQENFGEWMNELRANFSNIRKNHLLGFNENYSNPQINNFVQGEELITKAARIILGEDSSSVDLTIFCSEFVWIMLSLANCSPYDKDFYDPSVTKASCVKQVFSPMHLMDSGNIPGLTSGPLLVLKALGLHSDEASQLLESLFVENTNLKKISSGHRAMATNPKVRELIEKLKKIYPILLSGGDDGLTEIFNKINASDGKNYSPTSFLINTILDRSNPERAFDYVATIVFTDRDHALESAKYYKERYSPFDK